MANLKDKFYSNVPSDEINELLFNVSFDQTFNSGVKYCELPALTEGIKGLVLKLQPGEHHFGSNEGERYLLILSGTGSVKWGVDMGESYDSSGGHLIEPEQSLNINVKSETTALYLQELPTE